MPDQKLSDLPRTGPPEIETVRDAADKFPMFVSPPGGDGRFEIVNADPDFQTSTFVDKIIPAIIKMQGSLEAAPKGAFNPFHQSHYTDLAGYMAALRKPLAENGLCIVSMPATPAADPGAIIVTTRLYHESTQWMQAKLKIRVVVPSKKERDRGVTTLPVSAQELGSAMTYGRRYNIASLTNAVAEGEDDDGNAASRRKQPDERDEDRRDDRGDRNRGNQNRNQGQGQRKQQQQKPPGEGPDPNAPRQPTNEEIEAEAKEAYTKLDPAGIQSFTAFAGMIVNATSRQTLTELQAHLQDDKAGNGEDKSPEQKTVDMLCYRALRPHFRKAFVTIRAAEKKAEEEKAAAEKEAGNNA